MYLIVLSRTIYRLLLEQTMMELFFRTPFFLNLLLLYCGCRQENIELIEDVYTNEPITSKRLNKYFYYDP